MQAGAADQTELLNAQLEGAATQYTRLDSEIKVQQAVGALEDAVQRPILPEAIFEKPDAEKTNNKNLNAKAQRRQEHKIR